MPTNLFTDNASTTLTGSIAPGTTVIPVVDASKFPTPSAGQKAIASLFDAGTGLITEIVAITNVSGNNLTVVRAQEGTTALTWNSGDFIYHGPTAGQMNDMVQQIGSQNFAVDTGSGGVHYLAAFVPPITTRLVGARLFIKIATSNLGASDLNYGAGVIPIVNPDATPLAANALRANGIYTFVDDGTNIQFTSATTSNSVPGANSITPAMFTTAAVPFDAPMINGTLVTSNPSGTNLQISLKTLAGADPTVANPVIFMFRDPTAGIGDYIVVNVTAALSFTISTPLTMGTVNGVPFNLYVAAFLNTGNVVQLAAMNASSISSTGSTIFPVIEDDVQTSQAGTSGGNSAGLWYGGAASMTSRPIRVLGRLQFESGLLNNTQWNVAPDKIILAGRGFKKPGDVIQSRMFTSNAQISVVGGATTNIAWGSTPQITTQGAANAVRLRLCGSIQSLGSSSASVAGYASLFRTTNASPIGPISPIGIGAVAAGAVPSAAPVFCDFIDFPATAATITYGAFIHSQAGSTIWLTTMGTLPASIGTLMIEELQG